MGVGAVLDQEDALGAAELGDALDVEGDVARRCERGTTARGRCARTLRLEVGERRAEVVAVAVDEHDLRAGGDRRQRRRHERVRRAEHGLAAHAGELERRQRRARPAAESRPPAGRSSPPGRLERLDSGPSDQRCDRAPVPQLVQPGAIALIEADGEALVLGASTPAAASASTIARRRRQLGEEPFGVRPPPARPVDATPSSPDFRRRRRGRSA